MQHDIRSSIKYMKNATLLLFLLFCIRDDFAQKTAASASQKPPQALCDAAAPKLHESRTTAVVLTMVLDTRGKVESFSTNSPKGVRLEKTKAASAAIKAMRFEPAKKDGQPVRVMVQVEFDCSQSAADAPEKY
jgi:TonB family protein